MMTYVMAVCFILLLMIVMWYPGFMLARNMVKAVSQRNPTAGENILACIPGINTGVARTALYGSAKLVYIPFALAVITAAINGIQLRPKAHWHSGGQIKPNTLVKSPACMHVPMSQST